MTVTEHWLKIAPQWTEGVFSGRKKAEVRKHDRDYQTGDVIRFTSDEGQLIDVGWRITHVLASSAYPDGIQDGYCVLSIAQEEA